MNHFDNSRLRYNSATILRDYFRDDDTYNFKYGLESTLGSFGNFGNQHNMDEDPTIFGFDIVIHENSPLFSEIDSFLEFADRNSINEIAQRATTYQRFKDHFALFFNKNTSAITRNEGFSAFKSHYLIDVSGLNGLIHNTGLGLGEHKQFAKFGEDKITLKLTEDVGINAGYISMLYRTLIYSKINGKQLIPENLLRFDMSIIISEVRNFNRVSTRLSQTLKDNPSQAIPVVNDNISRYVYNLYDCELDFNSFSHEDNINQGGFDSGELPFATGISFDIFYKYTNMEMEKFTFQMNGVDTKYYMKNDNYLNLHDHINRPLSDLSNSDTDNLRPYDMRYRSNEDNDVVQKIQQIVNGANDFILDRPLTNYTFFDNINNGKNAPNDATEYGEESFWNKARDFKIIDGVGTIGGIIKGAKDAAKRYVTESRSILVSKVLDKARSNIGIKRISSPVNVYTPRPKAGHIPSADEIANALKDQVHNFTNLGVSSVLGLAGSVTNGIASAAEDAAFGEGSSYSDNILENFQRRPEGDGLTKIKGY